MYNMYFIGLDSVQVGRTNLGILGNLLSNIRKYIFKQII